MPEEQAGWEVENNIRCLHKIFMFFSEVLVSSEWGKIEIASGNSSDEKSDKV